MMTYPTEVRPIAIEMLQHLSGTFVKLVGLQENGEAVPGSEPAAAGDDVYNEEKEYQSLVATDVMENIESLMSMVEDNPELSGPCETIIAQLIQAILKNKISDFYDEAFGLVWSMTNTRISPLQWSVFDWLYQAFESDASEYFATMMPALHNYVTVDPKAFVSTPERVKMLISMCRKVRILLPVFATHTGPYCQWFPPFFEGTSRWRWTVHGGCSCSQDARDIGPQLPRPAWQLYARVCGDCSDASYATIHCCWAPYDVPSGKRFLFADQNLSCRFFYITCFTQTKVCDEYYLLFVCASRPIL